MNDFSILTDDVVGWLAKVGVEELFEKGIDYECYLKETVCMTKEQFKEKQRQERLAKTNNFGLRLADLMLGKASSNYDNSHIWALRDQIASEVAPAIRKRQIAWANNWAYGGRGVTG